MTDNRFSSFSLRRLVILSAILIALVASKTTLLAESEVRLTLKEYLRMVIEKNETIQAQLLATEASRQRALAEYGAFEPEFVGSAQHVRNKRPNTVEQQRNLAGVPILDERNNLYDTGLEAMTKTGAKVRLGYSLNNFNNNLKPLGVDPLQPGGTDEWQSFAGVSITQPLLRNGGKNIALANLRMAALSSDAAFQEYRRQLMVTLSQAESAYWGVYFAQEQLEFIDESVKVTEALLSDSKEKVKAGKGIDLDVLEAESGLALRNTKRNEVKQKQVEALGQLLMHAGLSPRDSKASYVIVDEPDSVVSVSSYDDSWKTASDLNPDYIMQKKKLEESLIRFNVARNQRLPELNLKGTYGMHGIGDTPGDSFDEVSNTGFPSWSIGMEMRVPIGGNIRGDHEFASAKLTVDQMQLQLQAMEGQIANALNTAMKKIQSTRSSTKDFRTMIQFNQDLLKTERDRLAVGKVDGSRVLEVEAGLFEVRQGLADSQVQLERAALELYLAEGSVLKRRGMDFTAEELRAKTDDLLGVKQKKSRKKDVAAEAPKAKAPFTPSRLRLSEGERQE